MNEVNYKCPISQSIYQVSARSVIGERTEQQDAIHTEVDQDKCLLIVCDGMGGFEGGSMASQLAVNEFVRLFDKEQDVIDYEFLSYAMDVVDSKVASIRNSDNEKIHAGSTCVVAYFNNRNLRWLSVGDSRLYIIRNDKITQMTRDHTVELKSRIEYSEGKITYQEFETAMLERNTLCSYLGINGIGIYDINERELNLQKDDVVVLATDGLYKSLTAEEICKIVMTNNNISDAMNSLMEKAAQIAKGKNQDNTSVILCKIN